MNLQDLKKPFPPEKVSWRVGATDKKKQPDGKAKKGIALAYIDARDVMQRLDEVCGPQNWQNKHPHANGKTSCAIGIKIGDEWVWKENGAGDSDESAEKGAFSDSFKRGAVLWGIGQYLYDVANVWVELDDWGKIENQNDPRLAKALSDAAKGIRGQPEPEPEVEKPKPMTEDEFHALKVKVTESITLELLNLTKEKARTAWYQMDKIQQANITSLIAAQEAKISAPPADKLNNNYLEA